MGRCVERRFEHRKKLILRAVFDICQISDARNKTWKTDTDFHRMAALDWYFIGGDPYGFLKTNELKIQRNQM